jgi:hypothetical protein
VNLGPGKELPALGQKSSDPDGNFLRDSAFCLAAVLLGSLSFVAAVDVIMSKIPCSLRQLAEPTRSGTPIAPPRPDLLTNS